MSEDKKNSINLVSSRLLKTTVFTLVALSVGFASSLFVSKAYAAEGSKVLVIYYSLSGNTEQVAKYIQEATGADMLRLETVEAYPSNYDATVEQAKKELEDKTYPALKTKVDNIASYDTIFVGSPNWWGTYPMPTQGFLASVDLSGKNVVPFITHEGSSFGRSINDLKTLCPNSTILDGFAVRGKSVSSSQADVNAWIAKLGLSK